MLEFTDLQLIVALVRIINKKSFSLRELENYFVYMCNVPNLNVVRFNNKNDSLSMIDDYDKIKNSIALCIDFLDSNSNSFEGRIDEDNMLRLNIASAPVYAYYFQHVTLQQMAELFDIITVWSSDKAYSLKKRSVLNR